MHSRSHSIETHSHSHTRTLIGVAARLHAQQLQLQRADRRLAALQHYMRAGASQEHVNDNTSEEARAPHTIRYGRVVQTVGPGPKFGPLTDCFWALRFKIYALNLGLWGLKPTNDYYWS